jgi:hypothetical protein
VACTGGTQRAVASPASACGWPCLQITTPAGHTTVQDRSRPARLVELLSALAAWRANIDAASEDPREEIAFHNALQQLARLLDHTLGSERRFNTNTPMPPDWGKFRLT